MITSKSIKRLVSQSLNEDSTSEIWKSLLSVANEFNSRARSLTSSDSIRAKRIGLSPVNQAKLRLFSDLSQLIYSNYSRRKDNNKLVLVNTLNKVIDRLSKINEIDIPLIPIWKRQVQGLLSRSKKVI